MSIEARRSAASHLATMVASKSGREALRRMGHISGAPVIAVAETDTLGELFGRIVATAPAPPAIVATIRDADPETLVFLTLFPIPAPHRKCDDDHHRIGDSSTVGMLLDYLVTSRRREISFSLTWGAQRAQLVNA